MSHRTVVTGHFIIVSFADTHPRRFSFPLRYQLTTKLTFHSIFCDFGALQRVTVWELLNFYAGFCGPEVVCNLSQPVDTVVTWELSGGRGLPEQTT